MKKDELLKIVEDGHRRVLKILDQLTETEATRVGFNAEWSVKDLLAHLTAWKKRGAAELVSLENGTWQRQKLEMNQVHEFNAEAVERSKPQSLPEVRADFEATHAEMLRLIAALPAEMDEESPAYRIANGGSIRHFVPHAAQLEEWKSRLTAAEK